MAGQQPLRKDHEVRKDQFVFGLLVGEGCQQFRQKSVDRLFPEKESERSAIVIENRKRYKRMTENRRDGKNRKYKGYADSPSGESWSTGAAWSLSGWKR